MVPDRATLTGKGWKYFLGYQEVTEAEYHAVYPPAKSLTVSDSSSSLVGWKPLHSEALAYHPRQKAEAEAHLKALGVPTEIDPLGRPVLTSRAHRRAVLKALKVHDRNGGYGDG